MTTRRFALTTLWLVLALATLVTLIYGASVLTITAAFLAWSGGIVTSSLVRSLRTVPAVGLPEE